MNMYTYQDSLPKLPLPPLEQTCAKLLDWSRVFLSDSEFSQTRKAVDHFQSPEGFGPVLQHHLNDLAVNPAFQNWLEPLWAESYLRNPSGLPLGSNVAYLLDKPPGTQAMPLPEYLAALIAALFEFNALILNEALDIDYQGKNPLCMTQYKTLISTTRIPGETEDAYVIKPDTSHVMLIHRGHYYRLDVMDDNGQLLSPARLLQAIQAILTAPKTVNSLAVGSLTTLPRKEWAHLRNHLAALTPENAHGLREVETALAVFVVDDPRPLNEAQQFKELLVGESWNRWYDKSLQFIVSETGEWGINYEHSGVDGTTLGRMISFLFRQMAPFQSTAGGEAPPVQEITFFLDDHLKAAISAAAGDIRKAADHLSLEVMVFDAFGKDHIKRLGVSPDSFVQIGLQLAQKRTFDQAFNAYESVMTKQFRGGRTETMRPVTPASLAFVENPAYDRLKTASLQHVARINECKNGQGIDRHLYGLKKIHENQFPGKELPALFSSPGYRAITTNSFSTSTSNVQGMRYAGYAPAVQDGFAFRYQFLPDRLHFFLSCYHHRAEDLERLKTSLTESMEEMGRFADA
ncbi:MAG: choline/carnitine O-acyltransferase [Bacillota bacterium]|nr:choline/carnitine O-acyltransferase [Bacillota bacterium]